MGQIYGSNFGSPAAEVSPTGELTVTGSITNPKGASFTGQFNQLDVSNQILTELRKLNTYMSLITDEEIKDDEILDK